MAENNTLKFKATQEQIQEMINVYEPYMTFNPSPYIIDRAKVYGCTITFYKTNVVLFQGDQASTEYNLWANKFHLEQVETTKEDYREYQNLSCIGSDEVGTGDFFGPITVCATFVKSDQVEELKKLGVKDSKLLTDDQIYQIGYKIIKMIPYSLVKLNPEQINNLQNENSNFNFIKAYLHNKAILSILKKIENVKYDAIIVDEFTPKDKYLEYLNKQPQVVENVITIKKGERAHISVAAASIIARLAFLKELEQMKQTYNQTFPKGAGPETEKVAITFCKSNTWPDIYKVAKMKFQNGERVKQYFKENPLPKSRQTKQENK